MVDSVGNLYFIMPHMGQYFAGAFWVGKVMANQDSTIGSTIVYIDEQARINEPNYYWSWGERKKNYLEGVGNRDCIWNTLVPCIASESSFSNDCIIIFTVPPSRGWNCSKGSDREGFILTEIKKTDLSRGRTWWTRHEHHKNVSSLGFGSFSLLSYNRNVFVAINDPSLNLVRLYWFHSGTSNSSDMNSVKLNYASHMTNDETQVREVSCGVCTNTETYNNPQIANIEPRITKIGNEYHFIVSNGIYPQWYKASASTGDTTWHEFNPHTYTLSTGDCCYHTDMQVMQHNGKNLALVMSLVKISHMSGAGISADSKKRWTDDKFVPWNKNYIALVISSWYEGSGYTNIDIPPDNIIEVFAESTASNAETTSKTTLYKNTHKFVTYTKGADNYIIYAYCYPGKSTQLYLGTCRYWFDSDGHVHLYTKREFRNKKGESFDNLTNCSRICSMDTRNGHLWITFATANNKQFCYFHAKTDDIVKFAP